MTRRVSSLKSFLFLAALFLAFLISPITAEGTYYYVDGVNGSDGNDGSQDNPWKTITYAISQASGTDTIYVKHATYDESVDLTPLAKRNINLIGIADGDARPIISSPDPDIHTIWLLDYTGKIEGLEITGASNVNGVNCIANNGGTNTAQITDCKVHGNYVGIHANAVGDTDDCSPYIYRNFIYSNTERGVGNMGYSSATIEGNYIYQNGSGSEGDGGIGNRDNSTATIINNIIYDNNAMGISINDANPEIINNTIAYHTASAGDGIRVTGISSVVIVNNIITHNKCGLVSQGGQPCSGNNYNDVWNNSSFNYIGFTKGPNDISKDPLFVNPQNRDYHLLPSSPCIDTGTSKEAPDTDFEGDTRPQGGGYDIGADECVTSKLHPLSPEIIACGDIDGTGQDDLIIDFGKPYGIYVRYNDSTWTKLHPLSPEIIACGDIDGTGQDDIIIDFGKPYGIYVRYNDTTWKNLHPLSPEIIACGDIDGNGQDDIIIDFGNPYGIYVRYNDTTWTKLHPLSPEIIACGDIDGNGMDDLIVDFGIYGVLIYYNNTT